MIIDNNKFNFSLHDTLNLRQLILENPDLPLVIFVGEDAWQGEYSYNDAPASKGSIQTLTMYNDCWMDEDDYEDNLRNDLCDYEEYIDMSDEEFNAMIDKRIAETIFCQAIVVYVG